MRVLVALLCVTVCVSPVHGFFEGTCLKEEPAPGVLVVPPGSHLSLTCGGQVLLDGVEVAVSGMFLNKTREAARNTVSVGYNAQSAIKTVTGGNGRQTHSENSRRRRDSPLTRASPEHEATPTAATIQQTRGYVAAQAESDWPVEEGDRVRRPQWRLNGKILRFREGVSDTNEGETVSISSASTHHRGRYSCHHRGKVLSSVKVVVAAPPERPILSCYKRSPSSKIRCEWTLQTPVTVHPHCSLYLSKGTSDSYSRINCSFSRQQWRCWCTLEHNEEEKRRLHMAYLCVTSIAGNATSTMYNFTPLDIIKPDPPSAVSVRVVEGQEKMLKVTWAFPCSWKLQDQYYELIYEISYRPATSPGHHSLQSDNTKSQDYTITDVLPKVEYVIQLRAKDEYDGLWSDWSTPVYAHSWTAPDVSLWSIDPFSTVDPLEEGSGIEEPSTSELGRIQDQVWHHVLWISGLCVLISLALVVYTFRHREKFVSKLHNCNLVITACAAGPHPQAHTTTTTPYSTTTTPSTPHPQEGHALVTFTPARCNDTLPNAVEEEEREPERKPDTRSEAISFNNTSYFLLQRDTESPPQQSGPKCL